MDGYIKKDFQELRWKILKRYYFVLFSYFEIIEFFFKAKILVY